VHLYASLAAAAADPAHPGHDFFVRRDAEIHGLMTRDIMARQRAGTFPADADAAMVARVFIAISDGLQAQWSVNPSLDFVGTIEWLWKQFTDRVAE
jgi:beta-glucosidase